MCTDSPGSTTLREEIPIAQLRGGGRQRVEAIVGQARHGHFAEDAAARREQMHQRDAAGLARHAVGADPVQEGLGIRYR